MSKRITLTDFEIEQIAESLKSHRDATNLDYQVIKVGKVFYNELLKKFKVKEDTNV